MLNIRLEIEQIDYERSLEQLLPKAVAACAAKDSPGELDKFLAKLGSDAVPVVKRLLGYLDVAVRDEIVVWLIDTHAGELAAAANGYLTGLIPGAIQIGGFCAEDQEGSRLALMALQVKADYAALLGSPTLKASINQLGALKGPAKLVMQMGTNMPPERLEKHGIALLSSEHVKPKLLKALSDALGNAGLAVTFCDMLLETSDVIQLPDRIEESAAKQKGLIPDAFEEALMDAVVAWLRDTITR